MKNILVVVALLLSAFAVAQASRVPLTRDEALRAREERRAFRRYCKPQYRHFRRADNAGEYVAENLIVRCGKSLLRTEE